MNSVCAFRSLAIVALCCIASIGHAQWRNAHWLTTQWIQFGIGIPNVVPLPAPVTGSGTSPASLADTDGDLLVFAGADANSFCLRCADGSTMAAPASFCAPQAGQVLSWLFLPWPGDTTRVAAIRRVQTPGLPNGWQRLLVGSVDLTANGGAGAMVQPPVAIADSLADKLAGVPHANGVDYWIIGQQRASNTFLAFRLRPNGVDTVPVVSHAGAIAPEQVGGTFNPMQFGTLTASYDGTRLASTSYCANPWVADTSITELFQFDPATGLVSLLTSLPSDMNYAGTTGIEFSPDGNKLYVADVSDQNGQAIRIWQFDLTVPVPNAILSSQTLITEQLELPSMTIPSVIMAAGPDGRIHVPHAPSGAFGPLWFATIQYPDSLGQACALEPYGLYLSSNALFGTSLPNPCKRYHDSFMAVGLMAEPKVTSLLLVWPVPTNGSLHVITPSSGRLEVLDVLGRTVHIEQLSAPGLQFLNLEQLAVGQYMLRFTSANGDVIATKINKE